MQISLKKNEENCQKKWRRITKNSWRKSETYWGTKETTIWIAVVENPKINNIVVGRNE